MAEELSQDYLLGNYARFDLTLTHGEGCRVWDVQGREYIDFGAGIAVCSLGHCHPKLTAAISDQAAKLLHVSNLYQSPAQAAYARRLSEQVVGHPGKAVFVNSGAEANEAAIKLARRFGVLTPKADGSPRYEILSFEKSFHGRTFAGISATGQAKIHQGYGPLLPGFTHLPFNDVHALEDAVTENTVAILLEPIQGEGGIRPADPQFLHAAARICKENNLLLLLDEIQCGFGRIGDLAGWKAILGETASDVIPHAVTWAKGIAGGYPMGATWMSDTEVETVEGRVPLSSLLGPGTHGTTYGGGPVACAAAEAVLQTIEAEDLVSRVREMGDYASGVIESWDSALVKCVRGMGLMLGVVLADNAFADERGEDGLPAASMVAGKKLMEAGMLAVPAGADVVRLLPPLNVTREEMDQALGILKSVLARHEG